MEDVGKISKMRLHKNKKTGFLSTKKRYPGPSSRQSPPPPTDKNQMVTPLMIIMFITQVYTWLDTNTFPYSSDQKIELNLSHLTQSTHDFLNQTTIPRSYVITHTSMFKFHPSTFDNLVHTATPRLHMPTPTPIQTTRTTYMFTRERVVEVLRKCLDQYLLICYI